MSLLSHCHGEKTKDEIQEFLISPNKPITKWEMGWWEGKGGFTLLTPLSIQTTGPPLALCFRGGKWAILLLFRSGSREVGHSEANVSLFRYITGDAYCTHGLDGFKSGMTVTQVKECLEVSHMFTNVNKHKIWMVLEHGLHSEAVWTCAHHKNFYHSRKG